MTEYKEILDIAKVAVREMQQGEGLAQLIYMQAETNVSKNERLYLGVVPFKSWRMVAWGFMTWGNTSTEDPVVQFGTYDGDIATDDDYFGQVTAPTEADKNWVTGDLYFKDPEGYLATPDDPENGGSPTYAAGGGQLGEWQSKAGFIRVTRPNDHTMGVRPFVLVEAKI